MASRQSGATRTAQIGAGYEPLNHAVRGIGSGYWRAVRTAEELMAKAAEIPRTWLCGVGFARFFSG